MSSTGSGSMERGMGMKELLYTLKCGPGLVLSQMVTVPAFKTFREMHNCENKAHCKPVLAISQWRDYPQFSVNLLFRKAKMEIVVLDMSIIACPTFSESEGKFPLPSSPCWVCITMLTVLIHRCGQNCVCLPICYWD